MTPRQELLTMLEGISWQLMFVAEDFDHTNDPQSSTMGDKLERHRKLSIELARYAGQIGDIAEGLKQPRVRNGKLIQEL